MNRLAVKVLAIAIAIVLVPWILWAFALKPLLLGQSGPPLPPILRIRNMSDLATTRVQIADFIEGENNNYKVKWALYREAVLGVDLSKANYVDINKGERTAIELPIPHVISSKVDHERSTELVAESKWIVPVAGIGWKSLRDEAWKHADRKIERLAHDEGYIEMSKLQAERVLEKLFDELGWKLQCKWCNEKESPPLTPETDTEK